MRGVKKLTCQLNTFVILHSYFSLLQEWDCEFFVFLKEVEIAVRKRSVSHEKIILGIFEDAIYLHDYSYLSFVLCFLFFFPPHSIEEEHNSTLEIVLLL